MPRNCFRHYLFARRKHTSTARRKLTLCSSPMHCNPSGSQTGGRTSGNLGHSLGHRDHALACCKKGQITVKLRRSQAVAYQVSSVHEKPEIVGLKRNPASCLAVQQRGHLYGCSSTLPQIADQVLGSHSRVHNSFDRQHVLPANVQVVTKEDFRHLRTATLTQLLVPGLHKLADHRHLEQPHQVRHEHETVLQKPKCVDSFAAVVIGDLPRHFAQALLDLLGADDCFQVLSVGGFSRHEEFGYGHILEERREFMGVFCAAVLPPMQKKRVPMPGTLELFDNLKN